MSIIDAVGCNQVLTSAAASVVANAAAGPHGRVRVRDGDTETIFGDNSQVTFGGHSSKKTCIFAACSKSSK